MQITRGIRLVIFLATVICAGCQKRDSDNVLQLASQEVPFEQFELYLRQELINDAPIGPGDPQPSDHCPMGPGHWFAGSGRSKGSADLFGELTEVEVYCVNVDLAELSGGIATWTDSAGDTITMIFGAKLLQGFAYSAPPNAPMIGFAQFTGGTGKWSEITGHAQIAGRQNGDGTASLEYRGTIYVPK